jgi:hypothetical protein
MAEMSPEEALKEFKEFRYLLLDWLRETKNYSLNCSAPEILRRILEENRRLREEQRRDSGFDKEGEYPRMLGLLDEWEKEMKDYSFNRTPSKTLQKIIAQNRYFRDAACGKHYPAPPGLFPDL